MSAMFSFTFLWIIFCSAYVSCEVSVKCELAAFLENLDGSHPILIDSGTALQTAELKSCDEDGETCVKMVEEQAFEGTSGGNFTLTVDERNGYTVGDGLCDKADAIEENIRQKVVHIYWRLCGSQWKPTSFRMPEPLCCEDGLYVPCHKIKSEL